MTDNEAFEKEWSDLEGQVGLIINPALMAAIKMLSKNMFVAGIHHQLKEQSKQLEAAQ